MKKQIIGMFLLVSTYCITSDQNPKPQAASKVPAVQKVQAVDLHNKSVGKDVCRTNLNKEKNKNVTKTSVLPQDKSKKSTIGKPKKAQSLDQ